eukprot:2572823-Rhodomonas_salina.5
MFKQLEVGWLGTGLRSSERVGKDGYSCSEAAESVGRLRGCMVHGVDGVMCDPGGQGKPRCGEQRASVGAAKAAARQVRDHQVGHHEHVRTSPPNSRQEFVLS